MDITMMHDWNDDQKQQMVAALARALQRRKQWDWSVQARPEQRVPPGQWRIWLILAGRGFGKTRTGAETIRQWVQQGLYRRICLLGHNLDDVRRVMIEGPSGLMAVSPPYEKAQFCPSRRMVVWPNGAQAAAFSATAYSQLRGPQFDAAWIDELAKFPYAQDAWDQLMMGLRLGPNPRVIITTTPRPTPLLKALLQRPDVHVTRGTTYDNQANLAPSYLQDLQTSYQGTRLGAQEIEGQMLADAGHGLWTPNLFRYGGVPGLDQMERIVVAIDPATTCHTHSNETGIIVAGRDDQGRGYILDDLSGSMTPTQWITRAVQGLADHRGDRIIAEVNNGGALVHDLLQTLFPHTPYKAVQATRSKRTRAEPIAALYEQGRIVHARYFPQLESQMVDLDSVASPDRMDALVWALTELFLASPASTRRPRIFAL